MRWLNPLLATTVSVILTQGNILNTLVNVSTGQLADLPVGISAIFIFLLNAIFNFLFLLVQD